MMNDVAVGVCQQEAKQSANPMPLLTQCRWHAASWSERSLSISVCKKSKNLTEAQINHIQTIFKTGLASKTLLIRVKNWNAEELLSRQVHYF
jgi:hypothetical protein